MFRVAIAQFDGATTLRAPPLAAGLLAATLRREPELAGIAIGSPYLDGTFDALVARGEIGPITTAVLETNRGCPFACTFCDRGQATQSRVHELPGERVTHELTWLAERGVPYLYLVDANFGWSKQPRGQFECVA